MPRTLTLAILAVAFAALLNSPFASVDATARKAQRHRILSAKSEIPSRFAGCGDPKTTAPEVPGMNALGRAYDLLRGNPAANAGDPGMLTARVVELEYGRVQGPWLLPYGVDFVGLHSCQYTARGHSYTGAATYSNMLGTKLSFSEGVSPKLFSAKFSGSIEFQTVMKTSVENSYRFASSEIACQLYRVSLDPFATLNLTQEFRTAVASLPPSFSSDPGKFYKVLNYFGTHFTSTVTLGGRLIHESIFTGKKFALFEGDTTKVSAYAQGSLEIFAGSYGGTVSEKAGIEKNFISNRQSVSSSYVGGKPFVRNNSTGCGANAWANSIADEPVAIAGQNAVFTLTSIDSLLTSQYFPQDKQIAQKQKGFHLASESWCSQVPNCVAYPTDPPPESLPSWMHGQGGDMLAVVQGVFYSDGWIWNASSPKQLSQMSRYNSMNGFQAFVPIAGGTKLLALQDSTNDPTLACPLYDIASSVWSVGLSSQYCQGSDLAGGLSDSSSARVAVQGTVSETGFFRILETSSDGLVKLVAELQFSQLASATVVAVGMLGHNAAFYQCMGEAMADSICPDGNGAYLLEWTESSTYMSSEPVPVPPVGQWYGPGAYAYLNGTLFLLGGYNGGASVHMYNIDSREWLGLPPLDQPIMGVQINGETTFFMGFRALVRDKTIYYNAFGTSAGINCNQQGFPACPPVFGTYDISKYV